jgi:hypothetical protein
MTARFNVNYKGGNLLFSTDSEREILRWLALDMYGEFEVYDTATKRTLLTEDDVPPALQEVPIVVPNRNAFPDDFEDFFL